MKNLIIIAAVTLLGFGSCSKDDSTNMPLPAVEPLTEQEKADLIFLREEEKFAYDVYVYANRKYNQKEFSNISNSELKHTTAVLGLLNTYGIADPAANNAEGVFYNADLQALYNQFVAKVDLSLNDAFYVGATIEDMDIKDLKRLSTHTTKADILSVYNNLTCGSRNHMRAFYAQLGNYKAQYITQEELDDIIAAGHESCGN